MTHDATRNEGFAVGTAIGAWCRRDRQVAGRTAGEARCNLGGLPYFRNFVWGRGSSLARWYNVLLFVILGN